MRLSEPSQRALETMAPMSDNHLVSLPAMAYRWTYDLIDQSVDRGDQKQQHAVGASPTPSASPVAKAIG